jgi:transposase
MGVFLKRANKRRIRTSEFKEAAVRRMLSGEPVSRLSRELQVKRSLLYRWRDAYRSEGPAGLRPMGRPGWKPETKAQQLEDRIADLQRKIGQQTMVIDFLRKAFKRVEESRRRSTSDGVTASMERSKP